MSESDQSAYLIALGSNIRHHIHGPPRKVIAAALDRLDDPAFRVVAHSAVVESRPLGPSLRRYANAAAIVETLLTPPAVIQRLWRIEDAFGRVRRGQRWGARTLDLDIVLWSGGCWSDRALTIPHRAFRDREFVLAPARAIAPDWPDPVTGLTIAQLAHRRRAAKRVDRRGAPA